MCKVFELKDFELCTWQSTEVKRLNQCQFRSVSSMPLFLGLGSMQNSTTKFGKSPQAHVKA